MNPFLLSSAARLADWKQFRIALSNFPENEQLEKVAAYWSDAPLLVIACDPETPENWLTPWEMISQNEWCRKSIAIGMEFTLRLAGWDSSRMQLKMIRDYEVSDFLLVLEIDGKVWLNYNYGNVSQIPSSHFDEVTKIQFEKRKYVKL